MSQDQPDGIEDDSTDLPDPLKAAERVNAFLSAYGDGLIVAEWLPEYLPPGGQPPLYARDLAALVDVHNQGLVLTAHIGWELAEVTSQRDQARGIAAHLEGELAQIPVNFAHVLADAQYEIRELKSRLAGVTTYTRDPADEKSEGGSVSQDSTNTPTQALRVRAMYDLGHVEGLDNSMGGADCACGESCWAHTFEGYPSGGACAAGWDAAGKLIAAGWRPPADDTEPWRVEARIHERRATSLGYCEYVIETYPDGEDDTCSEHRERGTVFCVQHQPDDDTETEWRLVAGADCYEAADEDDARKEADRWPASPLPVVEARSVSPWKAGPWEEHS